ncbi:hypothetical protein HDU93_006535 [Gonapodya sp. JEL0774]|nr:hypothetical protein HDU93_006535 [Gonapodya sp. JEL0774]
MVCSQREMDENVPSCVPRLDPLSILAAERLQRADSGTAGMRATDGPAQKEGLRAGRGGNSGVSVKTELVAAPPAADEVMGSAGPTQFNISDFLNSPLSGGLFGVATPVESSSPGFDVTAARMDGLSLSGTSTSAAVVSSSRQQPDACPPPNSQPLTSNPTFALSSYPGNALPAVQSLFSTPSPSHSESGTPDSHGSNNTDVPTVTIPFIAPPPSMMTRSTSATLSAPILTIEQYTSSGFSRTSEVPTTITAIPADLSSADSGHLDHFSRFNQLNQLNHFNQLNNQLSQFNHLNHQFNQQQPQYIFYQNPSTIASSTSSGNVSAGYSPLQDNLETISNHSGSDYSEAESFLSGVSEGWIPALGPVSLTFDSVAGLASQFSSYPSSLYLSQPGTSSSPVATHLSVPQKAQHNRRLSDQLNFHTPGFVGTANGNGFDYSGLTTFSNGGFHHANPQLLHSSAGVLSSSVDPSSFTPGTFLPPQLVGTPDNPVTIRVPSSYIRTIPSPEVTPSPSSSSLTASPVSSLNLPPAAVSKTNLVAALAAAQSSSAQGAAAAHEYLASALLQGGSPSSPPMDSKRTPYPISSTIRTRSAPSVNRQDSSSSLSSSSQPPSQPQSPQSSQNVSSLRPPAPVTFRPILIKRNPNAVPEDLDEEHRTGPHARKAGGGTLYGCPFEGCGKTFTRPYNLKSHYRRHEKLHSGLKPHHCPACGKDFARSDALGRHLKSEQGKESPCATRVRLLKQREAIMAGRDVDVQPWEQQWEVNGEEMGMGMEGMEQHRGEYGGDGEVDDEDAILA